VDSTEEGEDLYCHDQRTAPIKKVTV
jgi:hypothetical protein